MTAHPSRPRRSPEEQALLDAELRETFQSRITFNKVLGLQLLTTDPQKASMGFEMTPSLVGHYHYGRLHGGVISAVLDTTAGLALMCAIADHFGDESAAQILVRFNRIGTIDLRIDYLRPGIGNRFVATASVTRLGGRVGSTQMALHNEGGLLLATGAGAYVVS
jgi:uncharacterized protein (TIGR00369 family)